MAEAIAKFRGDSVTLAATIAFATVRSKPPWANRVTVQAPSATLELITVGFGPKIEKLYIFDESLARGSRYQDFTKALTDRDTGTDSGTTLNAFQTLDRLYIGLKRRSRGLAVDVAGTNGAGTAAMVGEYFPAPGTVTDLTITDGTFTTLTLAQDGLVTWTVPTGAWPLITLREAVKGLADDIGTDVPETEPLRWLRLRVDANLTDTAISVDEITALLNTDVVGPGEDAEGFDVVRIASGNYPANAFPIGDEVGGIELVSASITSAAAVNWFNVQGR